MIAAPASNPWRRWAVALCLVVVLVAVYFFTYDGYAISRDEWFLFDAAESFARRGDFRLNYEYDAVQPLALSDLPPPSETEPLQPVLAAGLLRIAALAPEIGLAHTVWLFNNFVTALTAAGVYAYGLALGYRARVAVVVALAFGLGTIAWPYSLTFFREPLFGLLALWSAVFVVELRRGFEVGRRPFGAFAGLGVALIGALLSKEAALFVLPALLLEALPSRVGRIRLTRRTLAALGAGVSLLAVLAWVLLNADTLFGLSQRYDITHRLQQARQNLTVAATGIRGYLFAPSYSVWVFSPVLLLGFFGWPRLARERRVRQILVPLVVLAVFVVGYALVRGQNWNGGIGWGARYLVPVTPFLALWLLPVVESLLARGAAWWTRLAALLVFGVSVAIQVLAALVPLGDYYALLNAQDPPVINWREQLWSVEWSPIAVFLDLFGEGPLDVAWAYATNIHAWYLPLFSGLLAGLALIAGLAWLCFELRGWRPLALTAAALIAGLAFTLGAGLYVVRLDPRYYGDFAPTRDLLDRLEPALREGDVVLLNTDAYTEFFMNYYRAEDAPVYTLPLSPGERSSDVAPATVESAYDAAGVLPSTTLSLGYFADRYARIWLVMETSPFIPWSTRPVEHYLAQHYFPLAEVTATDTARAVAFSTVGAPPATARAWPAQTGDWRFGDEIALRGYDLPGGLATQPGGVVPLALLWGARAPIERDYSVAALLVDPRGPTVIAQHDSYPDHWFSPTSTWQPGGLYRDNRAIQVPEDAPPGEYEVWLALYWWQAPADRLRVTDADGTLIGDHVVLARVTVDG